MSDILMAEAFVTDEKRESVKIVMNKAQKRIRFVGLCKSFEMRDAIDTDSEVGLSEMYFLG